MGNLNVEVKNKVKEIDVTGYPVPISTLAQWYEKGKIILNPNFQRVYRWNKKQKSEFIESLLLRLPIPSIFFSITEKGDQWEVVDWQQRLSSIFEFMWLLKIDSKNSIEKWLNWTEYLPSLSWKTFATLEPDLQVDFESTWLDCKMIRKESSTDVKFEIFRRLNRWWSKLTDQEVRSCIIIMTNVNFYNFLERISKYKSFVDFFEFSEKQIDEQFDRELALRFLVLLKWDDEKWFKSWVSDLLDEQSKNFSLSYTQNIEDFNKIEQIFYKTFDVIMGFWWLDLIKSEKDRKSIPLFDIVAWWIWYNIYLWNINIEDENLKNNILDRISLLKEDIRVIEILKPWKNAIDKIKDTFILWKEFFNLWLK